MHKGKMVFLLENEQKHFVKEQFSKSRWYPNVVKMTIDPNQRINESI